MIIELGYKDYSRIHGFRYKVVYPIDVRECHIWTIMCLYSKGETCFTNYSSILTIWAKCANSENPLNILLDGYDGPPRSMQPWYRDGWIWIDMKMPLSKMCVLHACVT